MTVFSFDPYNPGLMLAFAAGLVNTLSPCCLAMTPAFLAHATGAAAGPDGSVRGRAILGHTALYMAGFSAVFILIGISVALMGYLLVDIRPLLWKIGGALIIAMGLHQAGVVRIPLLLRTLEVRPSGALAASYGRSFVVGAVYSLGWTPCIGPVLGSILTFAAVSGDVWLSGALLVAYSLGMAVPHFAYALALDRTHIAVRWLQRRWATVELISGVTMVVMGILIFTGTLFRIFTYFQYFNVAL